MQEFRNKVAVVTGAASGIGRATAERCAAEGMTVVLADIEEPALLETAQSMAHVGARLLPYRVDVSSAVHLLFNNAGVAPEGMPVWAQTLDTWRWVIDVNLYGVIHGIRSFIPRMLASGEEGHVVNTASVAGLHAGPMISPYYATKHAVVGLSESLFLELQMGNARVGASVLCPAFVKTRIAESARNRPQTGEAAAGSDEFKMMVRGMVEQGVSPQSIAEQVFDAIQKRQFWILTHPDFDAALRERTNGMLERRNPQAAIPAQK
jgi:NAD(P)-dependent dehydrogenase (short-subunit alcohol dehydrogenase family)